MYKNILITISEDNFEYDVQSLVKAFFQKSEVVLWRNKSEDVIYDLSVNLNIEADKITFSVYSEDVNDGEVISIDYDNRKETKNRLKRAMYNVLSRISGKELPWGTLTGIRPTKIPMELVENGESDEEIYRYMKDTYLVSDEKIALAKDIARYEYDILKDIRYTDGYSLYIGIPFCPTTCLYCSFTSYPISTYRKKADAYVEALCKEIDYMADRFRGQILNTVYIGGGTPTTLEPEQLDKLLGKVREKYDFSSVKEFTVEAGRPDSITEDKLKVLMKYGVTRISINPQTMKQETLDIIGRRHTVEQVKDAFKLARELGFDNINMDFIVGLPDETIEDVRNTMEEVLKLNPDSITVHSLAIKRAARLNIFKDKYAEMTMENNAEIMNLTAEYATKMNMAPYYLYRQKNMAGNMENVGYARKNKEGIYNILIMEDKQTIVALGAGASTKYVYPTGGRVERQVNVKDVDLYIDKIDETIEKKESFFNEHHKQ
ncbi:MAG: coproporphyrinogen dehydrogenase HemZ [Lachnospiraceae bacterium]|nr:coproporphyrinogen dehydrogenase HemZ [Lachnospiraceae bacterium]